MKFSSVLLLSLLIVTAGCGSLKNRKEAAEDAKQKAMRTDQDAGAGPIDEDIPDGPVGNTSQPAQDKVLDDELSKMGIDPNNPEPEEHEPVESIESTVPAAPVKPAPLAKKKTNKKPAAKKKKAAKQAN